MFAGSCQIQFISHYVNNGNDSPKIINQMKIVPGYLLYIMYSFFFLLLKFPNKFYICHSSNILFF